MLGAMGAMIRPRSGRQRPAEALMVSTPILAGALLPHRPEYVGRSYRHQKNAGIFAQIVVMAGLAVAWKCSINPESGARFGRGYQTQGQPCSGSPSGWPMVCAEYARRRARFGRSGQYRRRD